MMFDTTLIINLAKHAGAIIAAAFILLAISPVQEYGLEKRSHVNRAFLILFFGFFGIMGTYSGNQIFDSFANLRAMSVITAGLYAGPLVGTGAGFIAALHRILIDPWGFSTIPCALATFLEGTIAGLLSKRLGRYNMDWKVASLLCFVGETAHMGMVLAMSRPFADAVALVEIIALPMMFANPVGTALFIHLLRVLFAKK
ncbi:MAG: LytS/YhcK type 5TM receptor domain-containing protein, partial [Pseudomonadota bacterium]